MFSSCPHTGDEMEPGAVPQAKSCRTVTSYQHPGLGTTGGGSRSRFRDSTTMRMVVQDLVKEGNLCRQAMAIFAGRAARDSRRTGKLWLPYAAGNVCTSEQ